MVMLEKHPPGPANSNNPQPPLPPERIPTSFFRLVHVVDQVPGEGKTRRLNLDERGQKVVEKRLKLLQAVPRVRERPADLCGVHEEREAAAVFGCVFAEAQETLEDIRMPLSEAACDAAPTPSRFKPLCSLPRRRPL